MVIFQNILTVIFGLAAVLGAAILLIQRNPVRAALGLLLSMVSIGAIYLIIGAHFVGFVHLMVYAGAIVILFLFAVMHFPVGKIRRDRMAYIKVLGAVFIAILLVLLVSNLAVLAKYGLVNLQFVERDMDDALRIGRRFMADWLYPFELISVLLLIAVIASVHITRPQEDDSAKISGGGGEG